MKNLITVEQMTNISNAILENVGNDFNLDSMTMCFQVTNDDLKKINEELFYRTRKNENEKLIKASIVKAKVNGVNFEFKAE